MSKEDDDQLSSGFPESLAQYNRQAGHYETLETLYGKGGFSGEHTGVKLNMLGKELRQSTTA